MLQLALPCLIDRNNRDKDNLNPPTDLSCSFHFIVLSLCPVPLYFCLWASMCVDVSHTDNNSAGIWTGGKNSTFCDKATSPLSHDKTTGYTSYRCLFFVFHAHLSLLPLSSLWSLPLSVTAPYQRQQDNLSHHMPFCWTCSAVVWIPGL